MFLSIQDRVEIVLLCGRQGWSQRRVAAEFNRPHPEQLKLQNATVCKILNKFTKTGSVADLPRSGRSTVSDETKEVVLAKVGTDPTKSLRRHAQELNMPFATCHDIMKKEKFRPYKPRLLQVLYDEDFDRRSDMCE